MMRGYPALVVLLLLLIPTVLPGAMARQSCTAHSIEAMLSARGCDTDYDSAPDTFDVEVEETDTHVGAEASRERYKSPQQRNNEVVVSSGYPIAPSAGASVGTVDWNNDLHHEGIYITAGFETRLSNSPRGLFVLYLEDRDRNGVYGFPHSFVCVAPEAGCVRLI